jgi:hypothetical protein
LARKIGEGRPDDKVDGIVLKQDTLRSPHPPAGATTLIISLGILIKPWQVLLLLVVVVLLILQAFAINRLAGIPYPLWNPVKEKKEAMVRWKSERLLSQRMRRASLYTGFIQ